MKRFFYIFLLLLSIGSCARREAIPDDKLAEIFKEIFLVNSYNHHFPVGVDSLQVYSPILEKWGYSVDDVNYTLGNFSKRKSARLSDVVERTISKLEEEAKHYKKEAVILDSIDVIALRRARNSVYADSIVSIQEVRDTIYSKIVIEDVKPGKYYINFDYLVDSLDRNNLTYRTITWFERDSILRDDKPQHFKQFSSNLTKRKVSSYSREMEADSLDDRLIIYMAEWRGKLKFKPYITIKNIEIDHTPPLEQAVEELYLNMLNFSLFTSEMYEPFDPMQPLLESEEKDSI